MSQVVTPGHVRLVLPGAWVNVPLVSPEAAKTFAQRVMRQQVGRDDRLARLRRDGVQQICDLANKARASGAHTLAMATEIAPGVPFAASLVGRDVEWPEVEVESDEVAVRLGRAFPGSELRELPAGVAARTRASGVLRGKEEQASSVEVLYRIPRPDSDRLLALRFTAPDFGSADTIAQLFDAIAGSVEFVRRRVGAHVGAAAPHQEGED